MVPTNPAVNELVRSVTTTLTLAPISGQVVTVLGLMPNTWQLLPWNVSVMRCLPNVQLHPVTTLAVNVWVVLLPGCRNLTVMVGRVAIS